MVSFLYLPFRLCFGTSNLFCKIRRYAPSSSKTSLKSFSASYHLSSIKSLWPVIFCQSPDHWTCINQVVSCFFSNLELQNQIVLYLDDNAQLQERTLLVRFSNSFAVVRAGIISTNARSINSNLFRL